MPRRATSLPCACQRGSGALHGLADWHGTRLAYVYPNREGPASCTPQTDQTWHLGGGRHRGVALLAEGGEAGGHRRCRGGGGGGGRRRLGRVRPRALDDGRLLRLLRLLRLPHAQHLRAGQAGPVSATAAVLGQAWQVSGALQPDRFSLVCQLAGASTSVQCFTGTAKPRGGAVVTHQGHCRGEKDDCLDATRPSTAAVITC